MALDQSVSNLVNHYQTLKSNYRLKVKEQINELEQTII
jgi:hypothetical protein